MSNHHQPYLHAVHAIFPEATHVRTGLHRAHGETTKCIKRSHIPPGDCLRASRGLKTIAADQGFFEGFEAPQALARGHVPLAGLTAASSSTGATPHERAGRGQGRHHTRDAAAPGCVMAPPASAETPFVPSALGATERLTLLLSNRQRRGLGPAAERLLAARSGEAVLDVACGKGVFAQRLAALGACVVAIGFSQRFLELARACPTQRADEIE